VKIFEQLKDLQLTILADQTGVRRAVVQQLIDGLYYGKPWTLHYITITAGTEMTAGDNGGRYVPKEELVGTLQVLLQGRRLQIPRSLPDATLLINEMDNFKAKPILATREAPLDWRQDQHDDMAVALATWFGEATIPAYFPAERDSVLPRRAI
jgi:hypothetical protein